MRKRRQINPPSAFWAFRILSYSFHAWKTGKNHKEQDVPVLRVHLRSSNLFFIRRFTFQNKGNLFLSLILAVHFNLRLRKRVIAPKIPRSVLFWSQFDRAAQENWKMTREKLCFGVRKLAKWKAFISQLNISVVHWVLLVYRISTTIKHPKIALDFSEAPKVAWSQNSITDYLYPLSFICMFLEMIQISWHITKHFHVVLGCLHAYWDIPHSCKISYSIHVKVLKSTNCHFIPSQYFKKCLHNYQ